MIVKDSEFSPIKSKKYFCKICNYNTCKSFDYKKHLLTDKHKKRENDSDLIVIDSDKSHQNEKLYKCECGKLYKYDSGYYRHKKNCNLENNNIIENKPISSHIDKDELIMKILKQNSDLIKENSELRKEQTDIKEIILEIVKNGTTNNSHNTTTNTTNTNSNNKAFNLQFFLNETCKDAMNITDFVNSIKLQLSDLETFGEVGYVEGITNIITTNLKALDVTQRPVHCTDKKRETMYVKDDNQWEKEDNNKTKLRKAINKIADKNIRLLPQFREKYPEYKNSSSKISDKYDKMVIEAMVSDSEKEDKIIHNISKYTIIDK